MVSVRKHSKYPKDHEKMEKHRPTDINKEIIKEMGAVGIPRKLIAAHIGISERTLYTHYRAILDASKAVMLHKVAAALFNNAIECNSFPAQKFIMQCQGRWRETRPEDDEAAENEDMPITKIQHEVLDGIKPEELDEDDS